MHLPAPPTFNFTAVSGTTLKPGGASLAVSINRTTSLSCPAEPCGEATWEVSGDAGCEGAAIPNGDSVALTAGVGAEHHINLDGDAGTTGLDCTLTATIRDAYSQSALQRLAIKVGVVCCRVLHGQRPGSLKLHLACSLTRCLAHATALPAASARVHTG